VTNDIYAFRCSGASPLRVGRGPQAAAENPRLHSMRRLVEIIVWGNRTIGVPETTAMRVANIPQRWSMTRTD